MVRAINKETDLPIYSYKMKLGDWNVVKNKTIVLPIIDNDIVPLWSLRLLQKKTGVQKLNTNGWNKQKNKLKNMKSPSRTFENLV